MVRILRILAPAVALAAWAPAQSFEAASIKRSDERSVRGSMGGPGTADPGQYSFGRATIHDLLAEAWDIRNSFQVASTAALDRDRFDVLVKIPAGATRAQFRDMMKALLAERFHLKTHTMSQEFPAFEMVVASGGPKLKESTAPPEKRPNVTSGFRTEGAFTVVHVNGQQTDMATFARDLQNPGDPPIFDKTGLTGRYDVALDYTIERANTGGESVAAPSAPDLAAALRQQLGLQLLKTKAPFEVVVVDSVDRLPTQN